MLEQLLKDFQPLKDSQTGVFYIKAGKEYLADILDFLQEHDADYRGFLKTAHESYTTQGRSLLQEKWVKGLANIKDVPLKDSSLTGHLQKIENQSKEILASNHISEYTGIKITDPFHMTDVENKYDLETLQNAQLNNTIIATFNEKLVGLGRLIEVSGSIELASLCVSSNFRNKGVGKNLISLRLQYTKYWPLYSFVKLESVSSKNTYLFDYYLRMYSQYGGYIPTFSELPIKVQNDLARMNDFWGSYLIIKIPGKKS